MDSQKLHKGSASKMKYRECDCLHKHMFTKLRKQIGVWGAGSLKEKWNKLKLEMETGAPGRRISREGHARRRTPSPRPLVFAKMLNHANADSEHMFCAPLLLEAQGCLRWSASVMWHQSATDTKVSFYALYHVFLKAARRVAGPTVGNLHALKLFGGKKCS